MEPEENNRSIVSVSTLQELNRHLDQEARHSAWSRIKFWQVHEQQAGVWVTLQRVIARLSSTSGSHVSAAAPMSMPQEWINTMMKPYERLLQRFHQ